jgi:hypothetical protein
MTSLASLTDGIITVGKGGRGFIVETTAESRVVITAAHCLPNLPPAHPAAYTDARTYRSVIGPLGGTPSIAAECLFADPMADVAVLGEPDGQTMWTEYEAYHDFFNQRPSFTLGLMRRSCTGHLFALGGKWVPCSLHFDGADALGRPWSPAWRVSVDA